MAQLTYDLEMNAGQEGQLADNGIGDITTATAGANVQQVTEIEITNVVVAIAQIDTWTLDTAADADLLEIIVNGVTAQHTSSGTDIPTTRDAFLAILLLDADFTAIVTPAASSTDSITLTSVDPSVALITTETAEADSAASVAITTPITLAQISYTVDGITVAYNTESTTVETERDAFLVLLQADTNLAGIVTFADSGTDKITTTADVAGAPFISALAVTGANIAALTTPTINQTGSPIPFGRVLAKTSTDKVVALPSATGFRFGGVSMLIHTQPNPNATPDAQLNATGTPQYEAETPISAIQQGRVFMSPEANVTDVSTQLVYARHTAESGFTVLGRVTPTSGANVDLIAGAEWVTSADADGLCIVNFNRP